MASSDLDSYFRVIETASKGEDVRDAIINAAKALKKMTKNAGSLEGNPPEYFARAQTYLTWYTEVFEKFGFDAIEDLADGSYAYDSHNVVNNSNLYAVLTDYLRPSLSYIHRYRNDPNVSLETYEAIEKYLETLEKVKTDIGKAIIAKGQKIKNAKSFQEYADLILHLDDTVPELINNASFTENKVYDANEQYPNDPHAYGSFRVNFDTSKLLVKGSGDINNKTYTPPEGKLFSSFDVKVQTRATARASATGSTSKRGKASDGTEVLDENGMLSGIEFTENRIYNAADEGAAGFTSFSVHVTEPEVGGQSFTVIFLNGDEQIGETKVEAYGCAIYDGEKPICKEDPNKVFTGWVPAPSRVVSDMECRAFFKEQSTTPAEIEDSWAEIVANRGTKYDIGDYKTLQIGTVAGKNYGTLIMEKVYAGENGSNSTWLSKTVFSRSLIGNHRWVWATSVARRFLNNDFIEHLYSSGPDGEVVADALIAVPKISKTTIPISYSGDYSSVAMTESVDRIWIPSWTEMVGNESYIASSQAMMDYYFGDKYWVSPIAGPSGSLITNPEHNRDYTGMGLSEPLSAISCNGGTVNTVTYANANRNPATWTNEDSYNAGTGKHVYRPKIVDGETAYKSWYVKYSSTNTSSATGYATRTLAAHIASTGLHDLTPCNHTITSEGTVAIGNYESWDDAAVPIGFCM